MFVITKGWTHLKRLAPEYIVQYETPKRGQTGSSVTVGHWSGTVHLRSERHIYKSTCGHNTEIAIFTEYRLNYTVESKATILSASTDIN